MMFAFVCDSLKEARACRASPCGSVHLSRAYSSNHLLSEGDTRIDQTTLFSEFVDIGIQT
jgi:hypothetical protein